MTGPLIVLGVLSVLFGLLVFNNFLAGFLSLVSIFIAYMVIGGILAAVGLGAAAATGGFSTSP